MVTGPRYPERVREEFRAHMTRAMKDDWVLDRFIDNFTATFNNELPVLKAHQGLVIFEHRVEEVRGWWARYKDCPDPRWWPRIVAQCIALYAAWEGHMPHGEDFRSIVRRYLDVTEEGAYQLVRFSGCHAATADRYFHSLWVDIVSDGPGLKDMVEAATR